METLADFLSQCFRKEPSFRATPSELLCHPWIVSNLAAVAASSARGGGIASSAPTTAVQSTAAPTAAVPEANTITMDQAAAVVTTTTRPRTPGGVRTGSAAAGGGGGGGGVVRPPARSWLNSLKRGTPITTSAAAHQALPSALTGRGGESTSAKGEAASANQQAPDLGPKDADEFSALARATLDVTAKMFQQSGQAAVAGAASGASASQPASSSTSHQAMAGGMPSSQRRAGGGGLEAFADKEEDDIGAKPTAALSISRPSLPALGTLKPTAASPAAATSATSVAPSDTSPIASGISSGASSLTSPRKPFTSAAPASNNNIPIPGSRLSVPRAPVRPLTAFAEDEESDDFGHVAGKALGLKAKSSLSSMPLSASAATAGAVEHEEDWTTSTSTGVADVTGGSGGGAEPTSASPVTSSSAQASVLRRQGRGTQGRISLDLVAGAANDEEEDENWDAAFEKVSGGAGQLQLKSTSSAGSSTSSKSVAGDSGGDDLGVSLAKAGLTGSDLKARLAQRFGGAAASGMVKQDSLTRPGTSSSLSSGGGGGSDQPGHGWKRGGAVSKDLLGSSSTGIDRLSMMLASSSSGAAGGGITGGSGTRSGWGTFGGIGPSPAGSATSGASDLAVDPFAAFDERDFSVDPRAEALRARQHEVEALAEQLTVDAAPANPAAVRAACQDLIALFREMPATRQHFVRSHGALQLVDTLHACASAYLAGGGLFGMLQPNKVAAPAAAAGTGSSNDDTGRSSFSHAHAHLLAHSSFMTISWILRVVNELSCNDAVLIESLALVGLIPAALQFAAAAYPSPVRSQAAAFTRQLVSASKGTLSLFIACGGIHVLVGLLHPSPRPRFHEDALAAIFEGDEAIGDGASRTPSSPVATTATRMHGAPPGSPGPPATSSVFSASSAAGSPQASRVGSFSGHGRGSPLRQRKHSDATAAPAAAAALDPLAAWEMTSRASAPASPSITTSSSATAVARSAPPAAVTSVAEAAGFAPGAATAAAADADDQATAATADSLDLDDLLLLLASGGHGRPRRDSAATSADVPSFRTHGTIGQLDGHGTSGSSNSTSSINLKKRFGVDVLSLQKRFVSEEQSLVATSLQGVLAAFALQGSTLSALTPNEFRRVFIKSGLLLPLATCLRCTFLYVCSQLTDAIGRQQHQQHLLPVDSKQLTKHAQMQVAEGDNALESVPPLLGYCFVEAAPLVPGGASGDVSTMTTARSDPATAFSSLRSDTGTSVSGGTFNPLDPSTSGSLHLHRMLQPLSTAMSLHSSLPSASAGGMVISPAATAAITGGGASHGIFSGSSASSTPSASSSASALNTVGVGPAFKTGTVGSSSSSSSSLTLPPAVPPAPLAAGHHHGSYSYDGGVIGSDGDVTHKHHHHQIHVVEGAHTGPTRRAERAQTESAVASLQLTHRHDAPSVSSASRASNGAGGGGGRGSATPGADGEDEEGSDYESDEFEAESDEIEEDEDEDAGGVSGDSWRPMSSAATTAGLAAAEVSSTASSGAHTPPPQLAPLPRQLKAPVPATGRPPLAEPAGARSTPLGNISIPGGKDTSSSAAAGVAPEPAVRLQRFASPRSETSEESVAAAGGASCGVGAGGRHNKPSVGRRGFFALGDSASRASQAQPHTAASAAAATALPPLAGPVKESIANLIPMTEVLVVFAQGDAAAKAAVAAPATGILPALLRMLRPAPYALLHQQEYAQVVLRALKTLRFMSMDPELLDTLDGCGTIQVLVPFLLRETGLTLHGSGGGHHSVTATSVPSPLPSAGVSSATSNGSNDGGSATSRPLHTKEVQNVVLHTLFNLCRVNRARQQSAAAAGIIPVLQYVINHSPVLKPLAVPLICDLAFAGPSSRQKLWEARAYDTLLGQLSTEYWSLHALNSLATWVGSSQAMCGVLNKPRNVDSLVHVFRNSTVYQEAILPPLLSIVERCPDVAASLSVRPDFMAELCARIGKPGGKAILLKHLLGLLRAVFTASADKASLLSLWTLPELVQGVRRYISDKVMLLSIADGLLREFAQVQQAASAAAAIASTSSPTPMRNS